MNKISFSPSCIPLFLPDLHDYKSWTAVFQSLDVFDPLVKEIFSRHNLNFTAITNLPLGTNAVFRVGSFVIKIYAPEESGFSVDWTEFIALQHAKAVGIPCSTILAVGTIHDKYSFNYLITDFIDGKEMRLILPKMNALQKTEFGSSLKEITLKMNVHTEGLPDTVVSNVLTNDRWNVFPESLRDSVKQHHLDLDQ
jgi:hypothetical protein